MPTTETTDIKELTTAVRDMTTAFKESADGMGHGIKVSSDYQSAVQRSGDSVRRERELQEALKAKILELVKAKRSLIGVTAEHTKEILKANKALLDYQKDTKEDLKVQEAIQRSLRTSTEKFKDYTDAMKKGSEVYRNMINVGKVGLAFIGAQAFSFTIAKDAMVKYNQSSFELSRSFNQLGKGMGDINKAYDSLGKNTTMSRQQFIDFAKSIHEVYLGVTPSSDALAKFSANLKQSYGPDLEAQKAGMKSLMDLQNEFPAIYDEIEAARNSGSAKAKEHAKDMIMYQGMINSSSKESMDKQLQYLNGTTSAEDDQIDTNTKIANGQKEVANTVLGEGLKMQKEFGAIADSIGSIAKALGTLPGILSTVTGTVAGLEIAWSAFTNISQTITYIKHLREMKTIMDGIKAAKSAEGVVGSIEADLKPVISGGAKVAGGVGEAAGEAAGGVGKAAMKSGRLAGGLGGGALLGILSAGMAGWDLGKDIDAEYGISDKIAGRENGKYVPPEEDRDARSAREFREGRIKKAAAASATTSATTNPVVKAAQEEHKTQSAISSEYAKREKNLDAVIRTSDMYSKTLKEQLEISKETGTLTREQLRSVAIAVQQQEKIKTGAAKEFLKTSFGAGGTQRNILSKSGAGAGEIDAIQKALSGGDSAKGLQLISETTGKLIDQKEAAIAAAQARGEDTTSMRNEITLLNGVLGKTDEKIADIARSQKNMLDNFKHSMHDMYDQAKSYNDLLSSRIDMERELTEAAMLGMGASVTMMQKQVDMAEEQIKAAQESREENAKTTKQMLLSKDLSSEEADAIMKKVEGAKSQAEVQKILNSDKRMDADAQGKIIEYQKTENQLTKDQMSEQKKIYDLTKSIREGYLNAISAMTLGAGEFSKIVGTQEMGVTQLMGAVEKYSKVGANLNTMGLGGKQSEAETRKGTGTAITATMSGAGGPHMERMTGATGNDSDAARNARIKGYKGSATAVEDIKKGVITHTVVGNSQTNEKYAGPSTAQTVTGAGTVVTGARSTSGSANVTTPPYTKTSELSHANKYNPNEKIGDKAIINARGLPNSLSSNNAAPYAKVEIVLSADGKLQANLKEQQQLAVVFNKLSDKSATKSASS